MFEHKRTYGEFLKSGEKISTNILADRLAMLECAGLLKSRKDEENRSKKIYFLTDKAIELLPAILEIVYWSAKHDKQTAAPKQFIQRIKNDKEGLIKELAAFLKSTQK